MTSPRNVGKHTVVVPAHGISAWYVNVAQQMERWSAPRHRTRTFVRRLAALELKDATQRLNAATDAVLTAREQCACVSTKDVAAITAAHAKLSHAQDHYEYMERCFDRALARQHAELRRLAA